MRPYYNSLDEKVLAPGWGYAKKYGAPQVEQAQAFGRTQWEKTVQPQLTKYQSLTKAKYEESLAPHVDQVASAVGPYYDIARTNALQTYHELLLPSYQFVQPYAQQAYHATSAFTTRTAAPTVLWVCNKTYVFLDGTVWPQLRVLYVENVEPQLVKIGQRLGRHSNGKKTVPKPVPDASTSSSSKSPSSFIKPTVSISSAASAAVVSSVSSTTTSTTQDAAPTQEAEASSAPVRARSSVEPVAPPPPATEGGNDGRDDIRREAQKEVAEDLNKWQELYSKAADEAEAEIQERVQEMTKKMIRRNARITGKSLLEDLNSSVVSELVTLRADILHVVSAVAKEEVAPDNAQEDIVAAVRRAGVAIKNKAQNVRTWRESYEAELQSSITTAAQTHFSILDEIRDLALQKIGMKWAWMDGVTYKDWAKYHELKNRLEEWKGDLERLIVGHPGIEAAQLEAANIEDAAMDIAATAAKELARLKQVASWKLEAADETPEFDSTLMQQAAEAANAAKEAAAKLAEQVQEAIEDVKDAVVEKAEQVTELAKEAFSAATSLVSPGEQEADKEEDATLSEAIEEEESQGTDSSLSDEAVESVSVVSEQLSIVVEPATDATSVPEDDATEDSSASPAENAPDLASTVILEETPVFVGNTTEVEEDGPGPVELPVEELDEEDIIVSTEAAAPSASIKPVFLGAAAQSVPSRQPVLDDDEDDEDNVLDSITGNLKSAYSVAVSRANAKYTDALSAASIQIHGTPKSAHEEILASVTSAYSVAVATASVHLEEALKAVSGLYGGAPTPTTKHILPTTVPLPSVPAVEWAQIESMAAERLKEGRAWAEERYENVKLAIGLATPTPSTPAEHVNKMLENAKHNYYARLGVAHDRYYEFIAAASSALSSYTATPTPTDFAGTASSLASVASESAASAASVVAENASSAAAAGYDNASAAAESAASVASSVAAAGYDNAAAAADKVSESWDVIVNRISVQIYGAPTPTPWYESAYSAAGDYVASAASAAGEGAASATDEAAQRYSAVSSIVSELLVGKEPTFSESVYSRLSAAYVTGLSSASSLASAARETAAAAVDDAKSVGEKVVSAASEATDVVKEKVEHVRDEL